MHERARTSDDLRENHVSSRSPLPNWRTSASAACAGRRMLSLEQSQRRGACQVLCSRCARICKLIPTSRTIATKNPRWLFFMPGLKLPFVRFEGHRAWIDIFITNRTRLLLLCTSPDKKNFFAELKPTLPDMIRMYINDHFKTPKTFNLLILQAVQQVFLPLTTARPAVDGVVQFFASVCRPQVSAVFVLA